MNQAIITLLSDLGTRDTTVTVAKTILRQQVPAAEIIDISHGVAQYDLQQAAYLLRAAYGHFPAGTVHVMAVDVFCGDAPRMLLAEKDGFFFLMPDNGLLPLTLGSIQDARMCFEFAKPYAFRDWVACAGQVIATLQNGTANFAPYQPTNTRMAPQPQTIHGGVECNILYIDRYKNVVLDMTRAQFHQYAGGRPFHIKIMRKDITSVSNNYNDSPPGEPLCRFNAAGFMEIALNHGEAATMLGLGAHTGNPRYKTIKINF